MNDTHVKINYIDGNLKVSALSSEAKELYRDKDCREHLYTEIDLVINEYLSKRKKPIHQKDVPTSKHRCTGV